MEQEIMLEFKILENSSSFISKNAKELGEKYAKKFIAVRDNELIAVGDNFNGVLEEVKSKGFDPALVLIEYIPGKEEIILY